jgi:hypothetical protein
MLFLNSLLQMSIILKITSLFHIVSQQEVETSSLQSLLFCMHAFLTAKVASVDPAFLSSITP